MSLDYLDAAAGLEAFLGDPCDGRSPMNYRRQADEDESEAFPQEALDRLGGWGLAEFYIPAGELNGRFGRMDELLYVLRTVARRDVSTAIAHAKTFLGAVPIWVAGGPELRRRCADLIRAGGLVSLGLTERGHGGDLVANDCALTREEGGRLRLDGEKWLINNALRCAAITVYAKGPGRSGQSMGSLVFVEKSRLKPGAFVWTPKIRTHGVRSADISGIRFVDADVSDRDFVGPEGRGLDATLRGLQLSRTLCCGLSLGAGDLCVRTQALFVRNRRLYGKSLAEHANARKRLCESFLRVLTAECVSVAACRLAHARPGAMAAESALAKFLAPELVEAAFESAENALGARAYVRGPVWGHFQKAKRDNRLVGLFDGSSVVNLQVLNAVLRRAMDSLLPGAAVDAPRGERELDTVFDVELPLPPLRPESLTLLGDGNDLALQAVCALHGRGLLLALPPRLSQAALDLHGAVLELRSEVLGAPGKRPINDPATFDASRRYAELHAAAVCLLIWTHNHAKESAGFDPGFRDSAWAAHAIHGLVHGSYEDDLDAVLYPWLTRLVDGGMAISFQPLRCPHGDIPDTLHLPADGTGAGGDAA